jgi:hypothetical protein
MNEKNYDFLKNQIKFTGFGEGHALELKELIQSEKPEFKIEHQQKFGKDETESTLHFKKSNQSDMYFFNSMEIAVRTAGTDEWLKQNYFIKNNEPNLTLKERYNLLNGRAVHKELPKLEQQEVDGKITFVPTGETYRTWIEANFKQTDKQGNFPDRKLFDYDLGSVLTNYPIKELEDNYDKTRLISSLEKGNLQKATLLEDGKERSIFIDANPRDKGVRFYDENNQRLEVRQVVAQNLNQEQGQDIREKQGQQEKSNNTIKDEAGQGTKKAESRRKSMRVSS